MELMVRFYQLKYWMETLVQPAGSVVAGAIPNIVEKD